MALSGYKVLNRENKAQPAVSAENGLIDSKNDGENMTRKVIMALLGTLVLLTTGCTIMAPSYMPDYTALDSLKRQKVSKMAIAQVEPKDPTAKVNNITLRGSPLASPSGSYAQYLEDAIKSDLTDINLFDPNSLFR